MGRVTISGGNYFRGQYLGTFNLGRLPAMNSEPLFRRRTEPLLQATIGGRCRAHDRAHDRASKALGRLSPSVSSASSRRSRACAAQCFPNRKRAAAAGTGTHVLLLVAAAERHAYGTAILTADVHLLLLSVVDGGRTMGAFLSARRRRACELLTLLTDCTSSLTV